MTDPGPGAGDEPAPATEARAEPPIIALPTAEPGPTSEPANEAEPTTEPALPGDLQAPEPEPRRDPLSGLPTGGQALLSTAFDVLARSSLELRRASIYIGPHRPTSAKLAPYECGIIPTTPARQRFPVKFYLMAMLFIVNPCSKLKTGLPAPSRAGR